MNLEEIDVVWITAGLSCDGDMVAMTGATQPSLEDLVHGIIPGIPRVRFHNPFPAYEVGGDFMKFLYEADAPRAVVWSARGMTAARPMVY